MGSEKFPDENDFDSFLTAHGGASNACTDNVRWKTERLTGLASGYGFKCRRAKDCSSRSIAGSICFPPPFASPSSYIPFISP